MKKKRRNQNWHRTKKLTTGAGDTSTLGNDSESILLSPSHRHPSINMP